MQFNIIISIKINIFEVILKNLFYLKSKIIKTIEIKSDWKKKIF